MGTVLLVVEVRVEQRLHAHVVERVRLDQVDDVEGIDLGKTVSEKGSVDVRVPGPSSCCSRRNKTTASAQRPSDPAAG